MKRQTAVKKSTRKWEELIETGKSETRCGFCDYFKPSSYTNNSGCKQCPLYPDICALYGLGGELKSLPLYWRVEPSLEESVKEHPILARRMLKTIKERGKKWVEEESND